MMEWRDEAIVLAQRPHGEAAAIVEVFGQTQGRHAGLVRGAGSLRVAPHLQPGTQVMAHWRARTEGQIGQMTLEPIRSRAYILSDRMGLLALGAVIALLHQSLPERAPHARLWQGSVALLDRFAKPDWQIDYLQWELLLLEELGFGLDLGHCALTGASEGLAYISPKTGRAVTAQAAGAWVDRLLPLPALLRPDPQGMNPPECAAPGAFLAALSVTGHFLTRAMTDLSLGQTDPKSGASSALPEARARFVALLQREARGS